MLQRIALVLVFAFLVAGSCISRSEQTASGNTESDGLEYCEQGVDLYNANVLGTAALMNEFGKEGWQVFSVVQETATQQNWHRTFFMKRRIGHSGKSCNDIHEKLKHPSGDSRH